MFFNISRKIIKDWLNKQAFKIYCINGCQFAKIFYKKREEKHKSNEISLNIIKTNIYQGRLNILFYSILYNNKRVESKINQPINFQ